MVDESIKTAVIDNIISLQKAGACPVIVHGGGPIIKELLGDVGIESEFIGGHRKTDHEAMSYVEMALSGNVNGEIVKLLNAAGCRAVGLSGKDAGMVTARKRKHQVTVDGEEQSVDLGHVGDVDAINTDLLHLLIEQHIIPVIAPIGVGKDLNDYNINADMFAGHIAGALNADHFLLLTDVDGLLADLEDPDSLIRTISASKVRSMIGKSIRGGMIPKIEACLIALEEGVEQAHIINGKKPQTLIDTFAGSTPKGTVIHNQKT